MLNLGNTDRVRFNWGETDILRLSNVLKDLEDFYQVISCDDNHRLILLRKWESTDEYPFSPDQIQDLGSDCASFKGNENLMSKDFGETRIFQSSSGEIFQKLHEWKFVTRTDEEYSCTTAIVGIQAQGSTWYIRLDTPSGRVCFVRLLETPGLEERVVFNSADSYLAHKDSPDDVIVPINGEIKVNTAPWDFTNWETKSRLYLLVKRDTFGIS